MQLANAAKTLLKIVYPNGKTLITRVVVQNIVVGGGNGNAKQTLTFTLAESGKGILSDTVGV
ncbi:MAG: capsid and scaffold (endogenous virus) [Lactobacillus phage ViSo-2018b]|nr:MAG: capsid and scaffold [Lactobacillus phage ViSo-2018b]